MAISLNDHEERLNRNRVVLLSDNKCQLWGSQEVKIYTFDDVNNYSDIIIGVSLNADTSGVNDKLEFTFTINLQSLLTLESKMTNLVYSWFGGLSKYETIVLRYHDNSLYLNSDIAGSDPNTFKHLYGVLKL